MKVQEALKSEDVYIFDINQPFVTQEQKFKYWEESKAEIKRLKSALSDIEKCEPVAQAIRERDRLGFAVVNVIGKLDEIIENTQEVEIDDFLHIAVPIDMWNELQAALEDMPKRAELYTSPQPIEKCEPVATIRINEYLEFALDIHPEFDIIDIEPQVKHNLYTSPQPREWVSLSEEDKKELSHNVYANDHSIGGAIALVEAKLKQLNTKG